MSLRLVGFPICPFVQRVALTLAEKQVAHTVETIELDHKPAWFLEKSPRGKVPALLVAPDGRPPAGTSGGHAEAVLVESQAICEYLDERFPDPPLLPPDALGRARDRAWFALSAEELVLPSHGLLVASDEADWDARVRRVEAALAELDAELAGRTWLSGDGRRFGLADVAVGPVFTRLGVLERLGAWLLPERLVHVAAWRDRFLARPSLARSVHPEFEARMLARMHAREAWALRRGDAAAA